MKIEFNIPMLKNNFKNVRYPNLNGTIPVSVVMPCFNCSETISRAIDSILCQTLVPNEIILIDDASSDNTLTIIQAYAEKHLNLIKVRQLDINAGAAAARNTGIKLSSNKLIAFLDSDDTWHPKKIEIQAKLMLSDSSIMLSGHKVELWDASSTYIDVLEPKFTRISLRKLLFKNYFNTPSVMIRNSGWLFPTEQRYAEDFKLWLDIAESGGQLVLIEEALAYIHKPFYGAGGLSASIFKMHYFEQKNLFGLLRRTNVNPFLVLAAINFAFVKFLRRLILVYTS